MLFLSSGALMAAIYQNQGLLMHCGEKYGNTVQYSVASLTCDPQMTFSANNILSLNIAKCLILMVGFSSLPTFFNAHLLFMMSRHISTTSYLTLLICLLLLNTG
jgi:hypothetical protein